MPIFPGKGLFEEYLSRPGRLESSEKCFLSKIQKPQLSQIKKQ